MCAQFKLALVCSIISLLANTLVRSASVSDAATNNNVSSLLSAKQLSQSAPYTIDSIGSSQQSDQDQQQKQHNNPNKSTILRLALNKTQKINPLDSTSSENEVEGDPWTLVDKNGTALSERTKVNLQKLLEALINNNITSELTIDDRNPACVNLTISNYKRGSNTPISESLLDEIIIEANFVADNSRTSNDSIIRDNHRYEPRHPIRSRPTLDLLWSGVTSPPLRRVAEMVAENYTTRKIAEEANNFAIKLLHQLNIEELGSHNIIQSPFAVYQGLTLLLVGAMGETAKEMDKALLGSQSSYENSKLSLDQDRPRLMASLSDVIHQLHQSVTNHLRLTNDTEQQQQSDYADGDASATAEQHFIVANNLLFSPNAFEISTEFKSSINSHFNNTALTKVEVGSTESIQVVNSWIRKVTGGVIPTIISKKQTFDEFNVMSLLCTSWLAQEWENNFQAHSLPIRSSIRLKGQARELSLSARDGNLLEFVDDLKQSHFVDYIKSEPTKNIHNYEMTLNDFVISVVVVPFHNSNHRLITLTPISYDSNSNNSSRLQWLEAPTTYTYANNTAPDSPDSSLLSKLVVNLVGNSRRAMRTLWNIVAPEILTKQTLQDIELARQRNTNSNTRPLVRLSMPIIRSEADFSISAALNHIGFVNPFDPNQANFIGINGHPFNYNKLHLSNVLFKTTFNLNERGINYDKTIRTLESVRIVDNRNKQQESENKKETLTDDNDYLKSMKQVDEIVLDKPFMYLICDIKTRLILYTGVMRNPANGN